MLVVSPRPGVPPRLAQAQAFFGANRVTGHRGLPNPQRAWRLRSCGAPFCVVPAPFWNCLWAEEMGQRTSVDGPGVASGSRPILLVPVLWGGPGVPLL